MSTNAPPPISPDDDPEDAPAEALQRRLAERRAQNAHRIRCAEVGAERFRLMAEELVAPARPARDRWYAAWRAVADARAAEQPEHVVTVLAEAASAFRTLDRVTAGWFALACEWREHAVTVHPAFRPLVGVEVIDPFRELLPDRVPEIEAWLADRDEFFSWATTVAAAGSLTALVQAMRREHYPDSGVVDDALDLLQLFADGGRAAEIRELLTLTAGADWLGGFTAVVAAAVIPPPLGHVFRPDELPAPDQQADARYLLRLAGWGTASGGHAEQFRQQYLIPVAPALPPSEVPPPAVADPPAIANWIHDHFRQQQHRLLCALWGREEVPQATLYTALKYTESDTAADTLRRLVDHINDRLAERADKIGERWVIEKRGRTGDRVYALGRLTP